VASGGGNFYDDVNDYASQLDIEAAHKVARAAIARAVEWR